MDMTEARVLRRGGPAAHRPPLHQKVSPCDCDQLKSDIHKEEESTMH